MTPQEKQFVYQQPVKERMREKNMTAQQSAEDICGRIKNEKVINNLKSAALQIEEALVFDSIIV